MYLKPGFVYRMAPLIRPYLSCRLCSCAPDSSNPGLAGLLVSLGLGSMPDAFPTPSPSFKILSTVCACCKPLNHILRSDVEGIVLAVSRFDQFFHLVICLFPACSPFSLRVFAYRLVFRLWRLLFTSSSLCVKYFLCLIKRLTPWWS